MRITVLECDWGEACQNDIRILLENVASHIERELRDPFSEMIRVMNRPGEESPRAFFRRPGDAAYDVNLTAKNRQWSQFAYQFGHEFCHVLSGHDRLRCNPNNWFHESLCELSSFFILRRMAERWPTDPPYPNWADYSSSLADYAQSVADEYENGAPNESFDAWLMANENGMRQNSELRDRNGLVALTLLPVFEQTPQGWNAVRRLPAYNGPIGEYVEIWAADVQDIDRPFVERIGETLSDGRSMLRQGGFSSPRRGSPVGSRH